ncbi:hypothetical protein Ocin01_16475 [Orchesella cincta]|uniref:Uncharacterized protein n=1 Tax=Orchesella cincta TaxID=48709 RepID=A0A1D2MB33_ORCCI|nr:hypothetical protein Ocin01_16475 [Orchesella cincta]
MRTVMVLVVILTALIIHARGELVEVDPVPEPNGFNLNNVVAVSNTEDTPTIKVIPRESEANVELNLDPLTSIPEKRSPSELDVSLHPVNLLSIQETPSISVLQLPVDSADLTSTQEKRNAPKDGKAGEHKGVVIDNTAHHPQTTLKPTKHKPTTTPGGTHATTTPNGMSGRSLHPPPTKIPEQIAPMGRHFEEESAEEELTKAVTKKGANKTEEEINGQRRSHWAQVKVTHNGTGHNESLNGTDLEGVNVPDVDLASIPLQGSMWEQVKSTANALNISHCPDVDDFHSGSASIKGDLKKADTVKEDVEAVLNAASKSIVSMNHCLQRLFTDIKIAVDITKKRRKQKQLKVKAVQVSKKKVKIDLILP